MFSAVLLVNVSTSFHWNVSHDLIRFPKISLISLSSPMALLSDELGTSVLTRKGAILTTPVVILAIDSRTPAFFLSPSG